MTDKPTSQSYDDKQARSYELGVLFIHGIGTQRRGDTLIQFAGSIYQWLKGWLDGFNGCLTVSLSDTVLESSVPIIDSPASTTLVFRRDDKAVVQSWLLAESWWAETLRPPTFSEFAKWAIVIIPWAVLLHFGQWARRANALIAYGTYFIKLEGRDEKGLRMAWPYMSKGFKGLFGIILLTPFVAFCGIIVQLVLILLLVPSIFPIEWIRSFLRSVQKMLSSSIGDSFVFLSSPVQESAILSKVQRDLAWLQSRCQNVAVVAHSQGAAVAYEALDKLLGENRKPDKLKLVVTFGSGIRKLFDLRNAFKNPVRWTVMGWGVIACSVVLMGAVLGYFAGSIPGWTSLVAAFLTLSAIFAILSKIELWVRVDPPLSGIRTHDYYSSHDPIPAGPLRVTTFNVILDYEKPAAVDKALGTLLGVDPEREVHNLASTFKDHTAYWSNRDEFVSYVVSSLQSVVTLPATSVEFLEGTPVDAQCLEFARQRRKWRVSRLVWMRRLALLAAFSTVLTHHKALKELGSNVTHVVRSLPSWLLPSVDWLPHMFQSEAVIGSTTAVLAVFLVYTLGVYGWRGWERRELGFFFSRSFYRTGGWGFYVYVIETALLITLSSWAFSTLLLQKLGLLSGIVLALTSLGVAMLLTIMMARRGPGGVGQWVVIVLGLGAHHLEATGDNRVVDLRKAYDCYWLVLKELQPDRRTADWAMAMQGCGIALLGLADSGAANLEELISDYEKVICSAGERGIDTSIANENARRIRERLDRPSA